MKRLILTVSALALASCGGDSTPPPPVATATPTPTPPPAISAITASAVTIPADNAERAFSFTVSPADANVSGLTLASSDNTIFTIENGNITPVGLGTAQVVFSDNGAQIATADVTVREVRMLSIGNSHTADYRPTGAFVPFAQSQNVFPVMDYHINCGKNLRRILDFPTENCIIGPNGNYQAALAAVEYDVVTIQPFWGGTAVEEVNALVEMIDLVRTSEGPDTRIFVYYTWPQNEDAGLDGFRYTSAWNRAFTASDTMTTLSLGFANYMRSELDRRGVQVAGYVPVGDVLSAIHEGAVNGSLPWLNGAGQLYRDNLHMAGAGRFTAGATMMSVVFDADFADIPAPAYPQPVTDDVELTEAQRAEIVTIIQGVID